jgi:hypothetical protein
MMISFCGILKNENKKTADLLTFGKHLNIVVVSGQVVELFLTTNSCTVFILKIKWKIIFFCKSKILKKGSHIQPNEATTDEMGLEKKGERDHHHLITSYLLCRPPSHWQLSDTC